MISLPTRTKQAIKIGLSMVIALGIALSMDWEKPYWAGIAVAMISLDTNGKSFNKGAMRMLGMLVYTLVNVLLWPRSSRGALEDSHKSRVSCTGPTAGLCAAMAV